MKTINLLLCKEKNTHLKPGDSFNFSVGRKINNYHTCSFQSGFTHRLNPKPYKLIQNGIHARIRKLKLITSYNNNINYAEDVK